MATDKEAHKASESDTAEFRLEPSEKPQKDRALLDRNAFMTFTDLPSEDVRIPEMGKEAWVRVRGLTGKERDKYEMSITVGKGTNKEINARNARAKLVVMCAIDDAGNRLFTDDDVAWLGDKSAQALERIFDVARRLSGLTQTDMAELTEDFS